ncbi:MAG: PBP1A family penicillin-binding protein [Parcubacteria group bacterium]|nr:PBP1A family penicillin-binding protein [Parcubacteria group bacterium]
MPIPHFKHSRSWGDQNSRPRYSQRRIQQNKLGGTPARRMPSFKRGNVKAIIAFLIPYALIAAALGILFVLALFAWYSRNLPTPDKIIDRSVAQSTKIYDSTGEHVLFEAFDTQRRTIIPLEQIPEHVRKGTILIEDKNFYLHKGFDTKGILRAVVKNLACLCKAEGGSTLTQQLIKNAILTNEKAFSRKIKEFVLAYQIERKFDKDQILQLYFNEIPYGSSAYGIESASQFYLGKSAKDLTVAEGAYLAALPRAPTYYSPYGSHLEDLKNRKNHIISLLLDAGDLAEEEAQAAQNEEVVFAEKSNLLNRAPHFVIGVREELASKYGEREVEQGGLKVTTTLDWDMQQQAEAAVAEFAERNAEQYNATNASLVALDPKTGHILAMVGSRDYFNEEIDGNFNVATQGARQPGSSFKPFVYAAGFEKGYTDKTTLWDVVTEFGRGADGREYVPHNYDLKEHGPLSVRAALQGSINIPAVKMLYLVGPGNVIKKAEEIGYTTFEDPDRYGLSLVLGGAEVRLIEHTQAYAMLANGGIAKPAVSILKVEDARGKVLQEHEEEEGTRVMGEQVVRLLSDVLSDNDARAYVFGASNYLTLGGRPVAAKTGTTNDYRDAWTLGYTPSLAAGVWVGNSDFSEMKRGADGSVVAAPIWNRFMRAALEGRPIEYFPKPEIEYPNKPVLRGDLEGGTPVRIDRASGLLATEMTPESFIEEKIFRTGHSILYYVDPEDPLGPTPSEGDRDPAYPKWEVAVERWMAENDWKADEGSIPTEYDNLHVFENKPSISIIEPSDGQTVSGDIIFFRVEASAPRGISRVEFYVDNELVAESRSAPYTGRYIPNPSVANGFHALRAVAYDDIDNSESVSANFNLLLQKTALSASWTAPKSNAVFSEFDFPVAIELTLPGADIAQVELFAAPKAKPSQYALISTLSPNSTTVKTTWDAIPPLGGDYEIYAVLWDSQNTPHRVAGVDVVVDVPEGVE